MQSKEKNMMSILIALLIGGLVGAGATLLVAPQSGEQTRRMLRERGMAIKDRAVETADQTRTKAEKSLDDLTSTTKERANEIKQRGEKLLDRSKSKIEEGIEAAKR